MTKAIEPRTERLQLRQWSIKDREAFAEMNADPRVMRFFSSPLTREQSDALAERCQMFIEERGWGFWATELTETRQFIGFVGLHIPAADLPFSPCMEIGWRLAYPYWGKGYATEAAREPLRIGFKELHVPEILSFTAIENMRSRAVMERIGMEKQDLIFDHPEVPQGSPLRKHCLYKLTNEKWRKNDV
jgi:RimJ/RimL family protein N-acetyltransferase